MFSVCLYRDDETGRSRFAVFEGKTGVWYFPAQYGKRAAYRLLEKLRRVER
jgi:hypothetical protein